MLLQPRLGRIIFAIAAVFLLALPVSAQVAFTFHATATVDALGYVSGHDYTFTFTTPSSYPTPPLSAVFSGTDNNWYETDVSDLQLWTSVGGSGLTGSFVRPTAAPGDPYSYLHVTSGTPLLETYAGNMGSYSIGLSTPGNPGANDILSVYAIANAGMPNFVTAGAFVDPNAYFPSYTGTYTTGVSGTITVDTATLTGAVNFTVTSLTITAVPEPSTYAAIGGLLAGAVAVVHRRRRMQAGTTT
jgi:hypothetical protein